MRKILYSLMIAAGIFGIAIPSSAKTKEENNLVKELRGGLPVSLGNNMTWSNFDITDKGDYMVEYIWTMLPASSEITNDMRYQYRKALTDPNGPCKGLLALARNQGKTMIIRFYNGNKELCIEETIKP